MADNSPPSWKEIYAAGTANKPKQDNLSSLAFRQLLAKSAAPVGSNAPKTPLYSGKQMEIQKEKNFFDTPVIKQVIDALSVGTYSAANTADDALSGIEKVSNGDLGGFLDIAASPVTGVAKGLASAVGNDDTKKTFADVIKHGQDMAHVDSENDAAKWIQGIGGFVGDVALDPTTYLSVGGTALAKGATRGFVEGGKAAARKAAEGARTAEQAGGQLVGRAAEINSAADKAGLLNRFKEAGVQAKGDYKEWMANNGGKIAKFEMPFKRSSNPKDAAPIADQTLSKGRREGLENLVGATPKATKVEESVAEAAAPKPLELEQLPFTAGKDGVEAPGRFIPEKTPEVKAEEQAITDGLREASKPDIAPIVDEGVKAEKPLTKEEILADAKHQNMQDILDTVKFSKQTYSGNLLKAVNDAHELAKPKLVEGEVASSKVIDTGVPDHKATLAALKNSPQALFKFGPKSLSKNEIVKRYIDTSRSPNAGAAMQAFWKNLPETVRQTVKKTEDIPGAASKEIPGTPINWEDEVFSKIHPDHREMSIEDLKNHRTPSTTIRDMEQYIERVASKDELAILTEKLGLSKYADKPEIKKALIEQYKEYQARNKLKLDELKAAPKEPKNAREAVGAGNQATAQLLDKVPADQALLRRANRTIEANARLTDPIEGKSVKNEFIDKRDVEAMAEKAMNVGLSVQSGKKLPHKFDKTATTTVDPQTGIAIKTDKWGTQSVVAIHGSIMNSIDAIAKSYLAKSGERLPAFAKNTLYRRAVDSTMANIRALGVAPYLDLGRGAHKYGVNLGMDDIAQIFVKDVEDRFFAGPMKGMQPQAFMTGVESLIRGKLQGKTDEEIVKSIMNSFTGSTDVYKGLFKDSEGIMQGMDMDKIINRIKGLDENGKLDPKGQGMANAIAARVKKGATPAEAKAAYLADLKNMAERWVKSDSLYQSLNNRMILNAKEHAVEMGAMVDRISDETAKVIDMYAKQPISAGDFISGMKKAYEAGKKSLGEADETKYLLWEQAAKEIRDKWMTTGEQTAAKVSEKITKLAEEHPPVAKETTKKVDPITGNTKHVTVDTSFKVRRRVEESIKTENMKVVDSATAEAKEAVQTAKATDEGIDDIYDVYNGAISVDTMRRIHPVSSFFATGFGLDASGMRSVMGTGLHTQVRMQSVFHAGVMNYLAKNPEKLMEDWKLIQNEGLLHGGGPFVPSTPSAQELYKAINMVFDVSEDNIITRNGLGAKHWNAAAKSKGLKMELDPEKSMLENSKAWLSHEGLENPEQILEFLSKAHAVSTNLASDIAVASNFARTFGSATPKPGYVKLTWTRRGFAKNKTAAAGEKEYGFFDLLPDTVYYQKEAANDIANIHRIMNEARAIKPEGPLGSFMVNVFQPITNLMKASQTVVRPGHWVNNTLGDVMRNYLAGVSSITPYRHAFAMMKANGKEMKEFGDNPLKAYEWHKNTTTGQFKVHGNGAGLVVHLDGKPQKISYESMYRLLQDGPVMAKHHAGGVAEDMLGGDPTGMNAFGKTLNRFQDKLLDNEKFSINGMAATRDNLGRIALAIDYASKNKFKDIHELKAGMEEYIQKWVPTSTDFTAREAKYVRPAFMYYTWLRGITPRIVDTMMNKPGVALAPSKALYNVAVANGIDPVSFGNPFPPDAQMPSYYYDSVIGPLMQTEGNHLWGINIANPVTDVMNTLGKGQTLGGVTDGSNALNMGKTLLGAASPFAKIPIDLATGQTNGVPIQDTNQYLQDALTGSWGGLISKSTGNLWNGQGRTDSANGAKNGVPQEQIAQQQIFNFLSGLKATDYNSVSAQKSFMGEQRNNLSQLQANWRRNQ